MLRPISGDLDMTVEIRYIERSPVWDEIWRRLLTPLPKANPIQDERRPSPGKVEGDALRPAQKTPAPRSITRRRQRVKAVSREKLRS